MNLSEHTEPPGSPRTPAPVIEIAVDNLPDALIAARAGAHRLELCSSLHSHGVSPSPRLLADFRQESDLPVAALVRPRAGDFRPSPSDHFLAPRQAEALLAAGADAIVFGFLNNDGGIYADLTTRMVKVTGPATPVFHRAFDLLPDPFDAIDRLIDLGVRRILTAGMSPAATTHALGMQSTPPAPPVFDSLDARLLTIHQYIDYAAGRIEILPCGGIRAHNAARFLRDTGATQLHTACRALNADRLDPQQLQDLLQTLTAPPSTA